jgi:hypothetical protein
MAINSQQRDFRKAEVKRIFGWARAGESASVIGISGVGKSNLFNHIRDPQTQAMYLGELDTDTIIVRVNFHYAPDFTDRTVYSLILEQLEMLDGDKERLGLADETLAALSELHEKMLDAGSDTLKVQRYFKLAVRQLLAHSSRRLVILCDQFDEVYREAEPRFFANLRGLREAYKYRVSYILFTRDMLPNLIEMDAEREEFYELVASNVMGLRPYNQSDAISLLQRIAQRSQLPLPNGLDEKLFRLTGGHAGLLRAAYLGVVERDLALSLGSEDIVAQLLAVPGVHTECDKIWNSLSSRERRVLLFLSDGLPLDEAERPFARQLQIKGVLSEAEPPQVFAPIFAAFIQEQEPVWERPLYFDEASRQVWVLGRPVPALTRLEYRLFYLLYERKDQVVGKDELITAGWPTAKGGVSDEALIAAVARLRRKIEPDHRNPRFVQNVHNQGYVLKVEE